MGLGQHAGVVVMRLLPNRTVTVHALAVLPDHDVIRFEYEVVPAEEPLPTSGRDRDRRAWRLDNGWGVSAEDDVGTLYDLKGGAAGVAADGSRSEGELDLYPMPPAAASRLDLTFDGGDRESADYRRHVIQVTLPLPGISVHEWSDLIDKYRIRGVRTPADVAEAESEEGGELFTHQWTWDLG